MRPRQMLPGYGALKIGAARERRWNVVPVFLACSLAFLALTLVRTQGLLH